MAAARSTLADAFAAQAESDWSVYQTLSLSGHPRCHALHYLQMATEKIAKAYRIRDLAGADPRELATRHTGFGEFVNQLMNSDAIKGRWAGRDAARESRRKDFERFAAAIERLAPAIDRAAAPENAEYPWEDGDEVVRPRDFDYPKLAFLSEAGGFAFLKLVKDAVDQYPHGNIRIR